MASTASAPPTAVPLPQQLGHRVGERQADDAAHPPGLGRRLARGREGAGHGLGDQVLAVDQGAVAIEHHQPGLAHGPGQGVALANFGRQVKDRPQL